MYVGRVMKTYALIVAASLALVGTGPVAQPAARETQWLPALPERVEWSSRGTAEILADKSVQLRGSDDWQEFTLCFEFPEATQIQRIRLEVFPPEVSSVSPEKQLVLFDVKPRLEDAAVGTTLLDFQGCRFLGGLDDATVGNCIDQLTDTGWSVPEFDGKDAGHQLILELNKPAVVGPEGTFAITLDSGGARNLLTLSRVRVSFVGGQP